MASSYADEWTSSLYGHFRFWYICLARTGDWLLEENMPDTCRRLTFSNMWDTLHADPLAVVSDGIAVAWQSTLPNGASWSR
jgi:hypothetical protein